MISGLYELAVGKGEEAQLLGRKAIASQKNFSRVRKKHFKQKYKRHDSAGQKPSAIVPFRDRQERRLKAWLGYVCLNSFAL